MSRPFFFIAPAPQAKASARPVRGSALRKLWPYIWPSGRLDLTLRIFASVALLLAAKLVTIAVPYSFKWATDDVSDP
ncbi:MAG TPA: metal ABC transporter permease, partial [Methylocella sp.]|nr:metal ABC transporter permease [Methylocella sp.]